MFRKAFDPTTLWQFCGARSTRPPHKEGCWRRRDSSVLLPFDFCQEVVDAIETFSGLQSHFTGGSHVRLGFLPGLDGIQSLPEGLVHDVAKGGLRSFGNLPSTVEDIIFKREGRSHDNRVASDSMMSKHQINIEGKEIPF
jgi:hypothetical protein